MTNLILKSFLQKSVLQETFRILGDLKKNRLSICEYSSAQYVMEPQLSNGQFALILIKLGVFSSLLCKVGTWHLEYVFFSLLQLR